MTKAQLGGGALVQGDRTFPSFEAMLDLTVAASPHQDRNSLRKGDGLKGCGTTSPR